MNPKTIITAILFLCLICISQAQIQWTKYAGNPVLTKGPDNFDIIAMGQPTVLFENDTIKMWYAGVGIDWKARICYATSVDGITWVKHHAPVLDVGGIGEWDSGWLDTPGILRDSSGYKLYYYGDTAWQTPAISSALGVAYSNDGINWTKEPNNPILTKGSTGDWDGSWVESPALIFDYNISVPYKMWFNGVDTATWKVQIGLATSIDGINWTKHTGNPVLGNGPWGSYDDMWLGTPTVLYDGSIYEMWYASTASSSYNVNIGAFDTVNICYATSTDGVSWTKHSLNPLFHTFTAPYDSLLDSGGPWSPGVIYNPNTQMYMMWFEAMGGLMLATSPKVNVFNKNNFNSEKLRIYPNPAYDSFTIETSGTDCFVIIYDMLGREILRMPIRQQTTRIETSGWQSGVYILNWINNNAIISRKIIKN